MKKICIVLLFLVQPFFAADLLALNMGEAINIAGRQRMLSQRIAQSYLLIGITPKSERGATLLNRSIIEFERNLRDLNEFSPARSLAEDLNLVTGHWLEYKKIVMGAVTKENAKSMLELSDRVLSAAHTYVGKLNRLAGTKTAEIIDISGKQRMLSQRIAKNYLAEYWSILGQTGQSQYYEDLAEYENTLEYLKTSDVNTQLINKKLLKVTGHFSYASKGFDGVMRLSGDRLIYVITGTTDSMLKYMNALTVMYAALLDS